MSDDPFAKLREAAAHADRWDGVSLHLARGGVVVRAVNGRREHWETVPWSVIESPRRDALGDTIDAMAARLGLHTLIAGAPGAE